MGAKSTGKRHGLVSLRDRNAPRKRRGPAAAATGERLRLAAEAAFEPLEGRTLMSGYAVTDLGSLGGPSVQPFDINSAGQVAGISDTSTPGTPHAFVYDNVMKDLGSFGGPSAAFGINDTGLVVGRASRGGPEHAFRHQGTGPLSAGEDLGTLAGMDSTIGSGASAVNNAGQLAGYSWLPGGTYHAFRHTGSGTLSAADDLGTLGGDYSVANSINSAGDVAGYSYLPGNSAYRAFLWSDLNGNGTSDAGEMKDLGWLGGNSTANGMNDAGQVVGSSRTSADTSTPSHAYLWTDGNRNGRSDAGEMVDLNRYATGTGFTLLTDATGVSNSGQVVGYGTTSAGIDHAYLYDPASGIIDLNTLLAPGSGWVLNQAREINAAGQIVGTGTFDGQARPFLLTPGEPAAATGAYISGNEVTERERVVETVTDVVVAFDGPMATGGRGSVTDWSNWTLDVNGVRVSEWINNIDFGFNATSGRYEATVHLARPINSGWAALSLQGALDATGRPVNGFTRQFQVLPPVAVGGEFMVNGAVDGSQNQPAVATAPDGRTVIAWKSYGQNGSAWDIYARQYDAAGRPLGSEFLVHAPNAGSEMAPAVAIDPSGNFVVAWERYGADGHYDVFAQRFDAAGARRGGEILVNVYTGSDQSDPSVAMDASGGFVVTWQSYGQRAVVPQGLDVYARWFDANGGALTGDVGVNTVYPGHQYNSRVASAPDGTTVITWMGAGPEPASMGDNVYARKFRPQGASLRDQFRVNSWYTDYDQINPSVAVTANGAFVIAFEDTGNYDGSERGVLARMYDADENPLSASEFWVNTTRAYAQYDPAVAADADGDFVVAWTSNTQDGSGQGIYAQRFTAAGAPLGEFVVPTRTDGDQSLAAVGMDADGDFTIAWTGQRAGGGGTAVFAQRYAEPAAPVAQADQYTFTDQPQYPVDASAGLLANDSNPSGSNPLDSDRDGTPDHLDPAPFDAADATNVGYNGMVARLEMAPAHGTLQLNPDGSFTYQPNPGYLGTDRFTYVADNGWGASAATEVTLTVDHFSGALDAKIDAGQGDTVVEGTAVYFQQNYAATYAEPNARYSWTAYKDGSSNPYASGEGLAFTFVPADEGEYRVDLFVNDAFWFDFASQTFAVVNAPPQINTLDATSLPVSGVGAVDLSASYNDLGSADAHTATVDWGDGEVETFSLRPPGPNLLVSQPRAYNGKTYYVVSLAGSGHLSWEQAQAQAQRLGGSLVTINDEAENGFVTDLLTDASGTSRRGWIGLTDADEEGTFRWASGEASGYSNWARNEPNDFVEVGGEDYGVINWAVVSSADGTRSGTWNDMTNGATVRAAVVEADAPAPATAPAFGARHVYRAALAAGAQRLITVTLDDLDGAAYTASVAVPTDADPTPSASGDAYAVDRDNTLTVSAANGVLRNDSDPKGDPLSLVLDRGPEHGQLVIQDDGSFTYTPDDGFTGTDGFTYRASDGDHESAAVVVTIEVRPVNRAPLAAEDVYSTVQDQPCIGNVLENDADPDGDALAATLVEGPRSGSVRLDPDGSFVYTPGPMFNGPDSFTYRAGDGTAESQVVTVTLTVDPVPHQPVAQDDRFDVAEEGVLSGGVLGNDWDEDRDPLSVEIVEGPLSGALDLRPDGSFRYAPRPDFSGTDVFTYRVSDGTGGSSSATVTLNVLPVNDAPAAADDAAETDEDAAVDGNVLDNDIDIDGDALRAEVLSGPSHGALALDPDGSFTYTPFANFNGEDAFTYRAVDGSGAAAVATVRLTVKSLNDAPAANPGPDRQALEGSSISFDGSGSSDPDGDALTYRWDFGDRSTATGVTAGHAYADNGVYTVTLTVDDGQGGTDSKTSIVTVTNVNPTAAIQGAPAGSPEGVAISLTGVVTDPGTADTFAYQWSVTKNGINYANGTAANFAFAPNDNGTYVVRLAVTDDDGGTSGTASKSITVTNVNPTPAIGGAPATSPEGTAITLTGLATDPGTADTITYAWGVTRNGAAYATGTSTTGPGFTFTPNDNGSYVVTLTATDDDGGSRSTTRTISVTSVAPTVAITGAPAGAVEGAPVTLGSSVADVSTADIAAGFTYLWSVTRNGIAYPLPTGVVTTNSTFTFTPGDDGSYVARLTVTDKDGAAGNAIQSFTVANRAPVVVVTGDATGARGQARSITLSASDAAADTAAGFIYTVNWGDGTPAQTVLPGPPLTVSHVYTQESATPYSITVTARDKDGAVGAAVTRSILIKVVDVQQDPADPTKSVLVVGGGTSNDTIQIAAVAGSGDLQVYFKNKGTVYSAPAGAPFGRVIVFGQAGADSIQVDPALALPAELYGGSGNDTLTGGAGPNILVGGDGDDTLTSGPGANVLIGGLGVDRLVGAGGGDLLVGANTAYDADPATLRAISKEWSRADLTYAQKVNNLSTGAFYNGNVRLAAGSVLNDGANDTFTGSGGSDWFIFSTGDRINDKAASETATQV